MNVLLLGIGFVVVVIYATILRQYKKAWMSISVDGSGKTPHVQLIIAYRNEADNLPALLQSLNEMTYAEDKLEVVFVNDHSSDNSEEIISNYPLNFSKRMEALGAGEMGKKKAIERGQDGKAPIILHTDADTILPPEWVKKMVAPFGNKEVHFVSGPVQFNERKDFFGRWLDMEFQTLIMVGAAHIQLGRPLMCNGANLAYRRIVIDGQDLNEKRVTGDDVFLMQSIAKRFAGSVVFLKDNGAMVRTEAPQSFRSFVSQRIRWSSKNADQGNKNNLFNLIITWLMNVVILVAALIHSEVALHFLLFTMIVKFIVELEFLKSGDQFFARTHKLTTWILGQPFHVLYMVFIPLLSTFARINWKGRTWRK